MMMTTVRIELNGDDVSFTVGSVRELLELRGIDPTRPGVAVAINDRVVRRAEWATTMLADGDRVEIITAMQGG